MNELTRMRRLTGDKPNQTIIFHLETIESQMQLPFSEVFFPEAKGQLTNVIEIAKSNREISGTEVVECY